MDFRAVLPTLFHPDALEAAKAHARQMYPQESCGYIVDGRYLPCDNIAADPTKDFEIHHSVWMHLVEAGATIQAVVHSHPDGNFYPSENDMIHQIGSDVPWIIIQLNDTHIGEVVAWGDSLPMAPLIGRPFIWGVFDCYSVVRDYYRSEHGLVLPPVARGDGWWNRGQDLYVDYLQKCGFQTISREEARPGDGFLMAIGGDNENPHNKLNHAGVLVTPDLVLHHLPGRLSRREPAGLWARGADLWVRHPELNQDAA